MFSGKLGALKQKWGHSSSLSSPAFPTPSRIAHTSLHRPSLHQHRAAGVMMSSALAHPVFPLAVIAVCRVALAWGMKDERERVKRGMKEKTDERTDLSPPRRYTISTHLTAFISLCVFVQVFATFLYVDILLFFIYSVISAWWPCIPLLQY